MGIPLELRADAGQGWATRPLAVPRGAAFHLELEVRWRGAARSRAGGFELWVGRHVVGSGGYRLVVSREPWRTVECRGPRLKAGGWHSLGVRVGQVVLDYSVGGSAVARCRVAAGAVDAVRLRAAPGTTVAVRRCRVRELAGGEGQAEAVPRFVYAAEAFECAGWAENDATARGRRAARLYGKGKGHWLVRGQDGSLPAAGRYEADFGLRGLAGAGRVWLEVARSAGGVLAARTLRLEELPRDRFARVRMSFACRAGQPLEYRVAAEGGRLWMDDVVVGGAGAGGSATRLPDGPRRRVRHALALRDVWGKAPKGGRPPIRVVALRRRLLEDGGYEFLAAWRHDAAERLDDAAVDLWVACRDRWGRVRVLDYAAAYDAVPAGPQATAARVAAASVERYGAPVVFFAQLYWRGKPVAAAWRKWGIPVDDVYVVEASVVGRLRPAPATE